MAEEILFEVGYICVTLAKLTTKQEQVALLALQAATQKEIAAELGVGQPTVHKTIMGNVDVVYGKRYGGIARKIQKAAKDDHKLAYWLRVVSGIPKNQLTMNGKLVAKMLGLKLQNGEHCTVSLRFIASEEDSRSQMQADVTCLVDRLRREHRNELADTLLNSSGIFQCLLLRMAGRKRRIRCNRFIPNTQRKLTRGQALRQFRHVGQFKQWEIADLLGVSQPQVSNWECGRFDISDGYWEVLRGCYPILDNMDVRR